MSRCDVGIKIGVTLATRCNKDIGHDGQCEGKGLKEFPYQIISWDKHDRRCFVTNSIQIFAWEIDVNGPNGWQVSIK